MSFILNASGDFVVLGKNHTTKYIYKTDNKDLLYSTGDSS